VQGKNNARTTKTLKDKDRNKNRPAPPFKRRKDAAPTHQGSSNQVRVARRLLERLICTSETTQTAVFSQPFQCAMPQSAKFAVQEMFAPDKRHQEIAALLDFATGLR